MKPFAVGTAVTTIGLVRADPRNIFNGTRAIITRASVLSNGRGREKSVRYLVTVDDPSASSNGQTAWVDADRVTLV